ncbi:heme NO-binding domain-containing protein [Glaciecola sp. MH2013]|nr:heme NO-binding domain-containing protein [Glaciecola sp. MH2013]
MKGIVFTEFSQMVEAAFGEDMLDDLIDATNPKSGGAYTSVGTYDHVELVDMVVELSAKVDIPVPKLIHTFGVHLGKVFTEKFESFFKEAGSTLELLKQIDKHIHVEVRKLYPDAELPHFSYQDALTDDDGFKLHYQSTRGFADLAEGLIASTSSYYGESFTVERKDWVEQDIHNTIFTLRSEGQ